MTTSSLSVQFIPAGITPTDEQRNIQGSRHRTSLVIANAGAAKTTTLALRIGEAISRGMAPEDLSLIHICFTSAWNPRVSDVAFWLIVV